MRQPNFAAVRDRLLEIARLIGVPDRVVAQLPESELKATHEQLPWWPDTEMQRQVLMFYLRSLAASEAQRP